MLQIVRQTWQERYDMYMSMPKEELATMLAENAKYTNPDACAEFADVEKKTTRFTTASATLEYDSSDIIYCK